MANKIPIEIRAKEILQNYVGSNDYILELKSILTKKRTLPFTSNLCAYIINNHKVKPVTINNKFLIHKSLRKYFQQHHNLSFEPEFIYINKLLTRKKENLHIWGCFEENCKYYFSIFIDKNAFKKTKTVELPSFESYTRPPKPHQLTAIKSLLENDKFILADDMGLGKTTSAILAGIIGGYKKILVVCSATLKLNWKKEISMYDDPNDISIIEGSDFTCKKWTIINYDILKNFHFIKEKGQDDSEVPPSVIDFYKYDLIIADEAHYLKNATANRTKLFNDFALKINTRWLLTGTPITSKPINLYNLLYLCESPLSNNWVGYVKRYCDGKQFYRKGTKQKYWVTDGATNLQELNEYTNDLILRRLKKDAIDLPQKTVKPIYLPLSSSKRYNEYMLEYQQWYQDQIENDIKPKPTEHLTQLIKIRQLLSEDKMAETISVAEDLIEGGHKVIIFSCFTNTIRTIHEHFGKSAVLIDGAVNSKNRDLAVERFQNDGKIKVFCGNIIAAGAGITLTEGTVVIFNDLDWLPGNHAQAGDRAYRIGQTKDVHIIYMLIDDTLDDVMYYKLQEKMKNINTVMGDQPTEDISLINEVVNTFLSN